MSSGGGFTQKALPGGKSWDVKRDFITPYMGGNREGALDYSAPADNSAAKAASQKVAMAALLANGRQSTILTGNTLGAPSTGNATLSGA